MAPDPIAARPANRPVSWFWRLPWRFLGLGVLVLSAAVLVIVIDVSTRLYAGLRTPSNFIAIPGQYRHDPMSPKLVPVNPGSPPPAQALTSTSTWADW